MKKLGYIVILFLLIFSPLSCEDSILSVDCDECFTDLTNMYSLEIKISFDEENSAVPITIYRGNIDDGVVISEDTVYANPYYSIDVEFGHRYSAIASYRHNGRIIYAVDGRVLKKKYEKSSCDEPCYVIKGDVLDLRLK